MHCTVLGIARPRLWAALASLLFALQLGASHAAARWVGTWGAAPQPPTPALGPFPASPSFSNETIRQVLRVSAGGSHLRIRISNEYGTKALRIGGASVALADATGAIRAGSERRVRFAGEATVVVPPGAAWLSDSVDLSVDALASVSVSLYLPEDTGPCTCHGVAVSTGYVSEPGDFTEHSFTPKRTVQMRAFISGVEVETSKGRSVIVLGDSISDGVGSKLDANHRWPDLLAARLIARDGKASWGVVNMGISGNRILDDGAGQSALTRFDRDVLAVPSGSYLIVFEGINDLGIGYGHFEGPLAERFKSMQPQVKPSRERMIAGYRQLIERAHAHGLKVLGATLTPYGGAGYYSPEGEQIREALNGWIRSSGAFDGVLDFDAVMRDPAQPTQMPAGLHSGDHLHPSDAGYEAMAKSIDLQLFK
jgi:lysophospholipase L1-like esterase